MLNRRHIRIKVLQQVYATLQSDTDIVKGEKQLHVAIDKIYELYTILLQLLVELRQLEEEKIADRKKRVLPTESDLKPNLRFVENPLLISLENNVSLEHSVKRYARSFGINSDIVKGLHKEISNSKGYKKYMQEAAEDFLTEREFIIKLFKNKIANSEHLHSFLEEESILWLDDIDLACLMVVKTLSKVTHEDGSGLKMSLLFKDEEEDRNFMQTLYRKTIQQNEENEALIKPKASNWEVDRIALMDMLLMKMALTEAKEFSNIPVKVTMNEYIEISKFYSTDKSNKFINGILDKLFDELTKSGEISKMGRGLVDK